MDEQEKAAKILPLLKAAVANWAAYGRFSDRVVTALVPDSSGFDDEVGVMDAVSDLCTRKGTREFRILSSREEASIPESERTNVTLDDALTVVRAGKVGANG